VGRARETHSDEPACRADHADRFAADAADRRFDGGPGKWVKIKRGGSEDSQAYQEKATGVTRGNEYEVNGVKFDGYDNGTLVEAKDNYLNFLDENGEWKWFFRQNTRAGAARSGLDDLIKEANDQKAAAGNTPIEWRVSSQKLAQALERTFKQNNITGITVKVMP
jgi:hypothetical protein